MARCCQAFSAFEPSLERAEEAVPQVHLVHAYLKSTWDGQSPLGPASFDVSGMNSAHLALYACRFQTSHRPARPQRAAPAARRRGCSCPWGRTASCCGVALARHAQPHRLRGRALLPATGRQAWQCQGCSRFDRLCRSAARQRQWSWRRTDVCQAAGVRQALRGCAAPVGGGAWRVRRWQGPPRRTIPRGAGLCVPRDAEPAALVVPPQTAST